MAINWKCYKFAWKRRHVYFVPMDSEEEDKRGKKTNKTKKSLKITVGEVQEKVKPWGTYTRKKPFICQISTNVSTWSKILLKLGLEQCSVAGFKKKKVFGHKPSRWVWCKKKDGNSEKILIPTAIWWRFCGFMGLFFLHRPWTPCSGTQCHGRFNFD